jgi:4-oxalocrotonate tautomerase
MPLVRISLVQGKPADFGPKIGEVVYRTMVETLSVPQADNFQVITEHDREHLVYDPTYLDIRRSDDVVFIQITLNEGRTVALKQLFYRTLAERLSRDLKIRMEDVLVSLVEVKKENWSFGNGIAQYAE